MTKHSQQDGCDHCWHAHRGPMMMVLPDGFIIETCCKCHTDRQVHVDHTEHKYERMKSPKIEADSGHQSIHIGTNRVWY